eukprot:1159909-Pelagomonas_calceolata.AAC.1
MHESLVELQASKQEGGGWQLTSWAAADNKHVANTHTHTHTHTNTPGSGVASAAAAPRAACAPAHAVLHAARAAPPWYPWCWVAPPMLTPPLQSRLPHRIESWRDAAAAAGFAQALPDGCLLYSPRGSLHWVTHPGVIHPGGCLNVRPAPGRRLHACMHACIH